MNMNATGLQSEKARATLRTLIASMDEEMARLPAFGAANDGSATRLVGLWKDLVRTLDLGPAPRMRRCPFCGRSGMAAATMCGYCWTKRAPLPV